MKTFAGEKMLNFIVLVLFLGGVAIKYLFLWPVTLFVVLSMLPDKIRLK